MCVMERLCAWFQSTVGYGSRARPVPGLTHAADADADTLGPMAIDRSQAIIDEIRKTPGQWLYHYTTLETALVHILPTRRLRLGSFSQMRDPREYKQWFPGAVGFYEGDIDALMPAYAASAARLNLLRDEFKLLSLTLDGEDPEEGVYGRGFARSRLWEAYAGRHSGVCFVLRKDNAVEVIAPQLEAAGRAAHGPVRYKNTPTHTEIMFNFEQIIAGDIDAIADRIAEQHLDKLFLMKNTEWDSEREYRFIVRSPREYEYVDVSRALVAVCRGPESASDSEHALRYFANEFAIALGFVQWDHNQPMLLGRALK
jgi:hypothetical protein